MDLDTLKTFLGWSLVLNYGVLVIWMGFLMVARDWVVGIHSRMFDLEAAQVRAYHFQLAGIYKMMIFVFNLAPWLALLIMGV